MKRGGTDPTGAPGATDRSSRESELHSQRAGTNFVNDLGRPRAANLIGVPFTTRHGSLREELCVITERSVVSRLVCRIRTTLLHSGQTCSAR